MPHEISMYPIGYQRGYIPYEISIFHGASNEIPWDTPWDTLISPRLFEFFPFFFFLPLGCCGDRSHNLGCCGDRSLHLVTTQQNLAHELM